MALPAMRADMDEAHAVHVVHLKRDLRRCQSLELMAFHLYEIVKDERAGLWHDLSVAEKRAYRVSCEELVEDIKAEQQREA